MPEQQLVVPSKKFTVPEVIIHTPKQREDVVLVMSDLHFGKRTASYNIAAFKRRMTALGKRLGEIRELLHGYDFDCFHPLLLGDCVDGMGIYPGQEHYQVKTNVDTQVDEWSDFMREWLLEQKRIWTSVESDMVPGNHGRISKFAHERANYDMMAYKYLKLKMGKEVKINFNSPQEDPDPFVRKVFVRRHPILMYHGNEIKSYQNIPWYGIFIRSARWAISRNSPFELLTMGHFHTYGCWDFNKITAMLTGTMVTDDDWALRTLGMDSANKWAMFGVSDRYVRTWQFDMNLVGKPSKPVTHNRMTQDVLEALGDTE